MIYHICTYGWISVVWQCFHLPACINSKMKLSCLLLLKVTLSLLLSVHSRTRRDIVVPADLSFTDSYQTEFIKRIEDEYLNETLAGKGFSTFNESVFERQPSTDAPSPSPSASPSAIPTTSPSASPSEMPSSAPTVDPFSSAEEPVNPSDWYFNYNFESKYGPNNWGSVGLPRNPYWSEFDDPGC